MACLSSLPILTIALWYDWRMDSATDSKKTGNNTGFASHTVRHAGYRTEV